MGNEELIVNVRQRAKAMEFGTRWMILELCRRFEFATAIDAVPVVWCSECKYCDTENMHCDHPMGTALPVGRKPNDFCSYGERREVDGE